MKNELRETVRSITPKFIVFFIVGSVTLSMLTITTYIDWASGFGAALLAISRSASIFALGAPFVIGAALLLPSFYKSKGSTIVSYEKFDERFLTISRFLVLLILSSIFMISWTLLSYSYAMQEYLHVSPDLILAYLPGTIISGLIKQLSVADSAQFRQQDPIFGHSSLYLQKDIHCKECCILESH